MKTKSIIFVPTIQHTGTWFLLNFLQNFTPNLIENLGCMKKEGRISKPVIIHPHFPIRGELGKEEIETSKTMSVGEIYILSKIFKTIIPIRDPMAAILTREARHPELRHFYIVDAFLQVATRFVGNPNVKFFPIDLYKTFEERRKLLISIVNHCQINPDLHGDLIDTFARKWKVKNKTPSNRFKKLYIGKDLSRLEFLLGPKWAEIEYLKRQGGVIAPFLFNLGYSGGDLLW
jgi:hypothetical protein